MRQPNIYKGIMGVMDMTYKEMSDKISSYGFYAGDVSEVCRAVRGYSGPKYDKIRRYLIISFTEWLAELDGKEENEGIKPFVKMSDIITRRSV